MRLEHIHEADLTRRQFLKVGGQAVAAAAAPQSMLKGVINVTPKAVRTGHELLKITDPKTAVQVMGFGDMAMWKYLISKGPLYVGMKPGKGIPDVKDPPKQSFGDAWNYTPGWGPGDRVFGQPRPPAPVGSAWGRLNPDDRFMWLAHPASNLVRTRREEPIYSLIKGLNPKLINWAIPADAQTEKMLQSIGMKPESLSSYTIANLAPNSEAGKKAKVEIAQQDAKAKKNYEDYWNSEEGKKHKAIIDKQKEEYKKQEYEEGRLDSEYVSDSWRSQSTEFESKTSRQRRIFENLDDTRRLTAY